MEQKKPKSIILHIPIFSSVIILASLLSRVWPETASVLIFDRSALIRGEIWRMFTCHFVHFSNTHLAYNLFAFSIAVYIIEKKNYADFYMLYLCSAFAISISLFILKPDMTLYGGLSGIACGSLYYCALMGIKETPVWQRICFLTVIFIPLKIVVEFYNSASILPYGVHQSFVSMPTSHIIGCFVAVLFYIASAEVRGATELREANALIKAYAIHFIGQQPRDLRKAWKKQLNQVKLNICSRS